MESDHSRNFLCKPRIQVFTIIQGSRTKTSSPRTAFDRTVDLFAQKLTVDRTLFLIHTCNTTSYLQYHIVPAIPHRTCNTTSCLQYHTIPAIPHHACNTTSCLQYHFHTIATLYSLLYTPPAAPSLSTAGPHILAPSP